MSADLNLRQVGESYKDYAARMAGCARAAEQDRAAALAEVERLTAAVLALHVDGGRSQGFVDGGYGDMPHACTTCGTHGEYGTPWPCATARAVAGDES